MQLSGSSEAEGETEEEVNCFFQQFDSFGQWPLLFCLAHAERYPCRRPQGRNASPV